MSAAKWETSDSGHRAVLRAAGEFDKDSFRSKKHGKGVSLILGKHDSDKSVLMVQSVVFDKENFESLSDAKKWWSDSADSVDKTYDSRSGSPLDTKTIAATGITKSFTTMQTSAEGTEGNITKGISVPTPEELDKINQFTRTPKTAEEVAVFPVLACNDIIDRDFDRFPPETVAGFAALQGPLSPVGKSFMVGHDYRGGNGYCGLPVGRVFDAEAVKEGDVTWLRNKVYIPNTEQYKSYLENVDFGIYWAVSVGVMLGGAMCSVGEAHDWGWHPYVCSMGHEKGLRYDPAEEVELYGRPEPVEASGDLCWRDLVDPQDFYELSQVYLGAQYMAELDKSSNKPSFQKAAEFGGVKVLGFKSDELPELPTAAIYPEDSRFAKAVEAGLEIIVTDGESKFTDEDGLVWTFDAETEEELCLGRAEKDSDDEEDDESADDEETDDDSDDDSSDDDETDDSEAEDAEEQKDPELAKRLASAHSFLALVEDKAVDADEMSDRVKALSVSIDQCMEAMDEGDTDTARALMTACEQLIESLMTTLGMGEGDDESDDEAEPTLDNVDLNMEVDEVPKEAVLEAVKTLKLPAAVEEAVTAAEDSTAVKVALEATAKELRQALETNKALEKRAALGAEYVKDLRAEATHWYVHASKDPQDPKKGVSLERFEKLLTVIGDDVDLLKSQIEEYKSAARAKFPEAVRRSSFPADVNQRPDGLENPDAVEQVDTTAAGRIHQ